MVRLVRFFVTLAALILPAAASVTLTVASPVVPPPTGAYIQVDLVNCASGAYVNSSTLVPQSQRFYLNGQPSVTFTIADNVTGIVCPVPTSTQSAPNLLSYYTVSYFFAGSQTVLKSVELPPGTLNLANLANLPQAPYQPGSTLGPIGPPGTSGGIYDLASYSGATLDQALLAATTQLAGQSAIFTISPAAIVKFAPLSNTVTLNANHWLNIIAPLTSSGDSTHIIISSGGGVMCSGGAGRVVSAVHDGTGLFWTAPGATNVSINGCNASGFDAGTFLAYTGGAASNIRLSNIVTSGIGAHLVQNGVASVSDLSYSNISVANGPNWAIYLNGANIQRVAGVNIDCSTMGDCIEGYAADASTFPSKAAVLALNSGNWTFTNTTCHSIVACGYTNSNYNVDFIGGKFDGTLGDTVLDPEGSVNVRYFNWQITRTSGGNFGISTFYSGYGNEFHNITINELDGLEPIRIKYAGGIGAYGVQDTVFDAVNVNCSTACQAVFEGNVNTTIKNSSWTDVSIFDIGNASLGLKVQDNWMTFTKAVSAGLVIPTSLGGSRNFVQRNHIITTFSQASTVPALSINSANGNAVEAWEIEQNWFEGPWGVDAKVSNNGGNVGAIFNFVGNHTQANKFVVGVSNAAVTLLQLKNCTLYEAVCDSQARGSAGWQTNTPDTWNGTTISGPNNQFNGRVVNNSEVHIWSQAATTAGLPNDWRTGVDANGVQTFSICPIGFGSACTVLQQFLPNGVFRVNSLGGSGNQVVCADLNGSLYRGTSGACGTPPSALSAMPQATTTPGP